MEILLKMKQADNSQFNFLSFDNELHAYYRHMMNAIKNGRYKQSTESEESKGRYSFDAYENTRSTEENEIRWSRLWKVVGIIEFQFEL